MRRGIQGKLKKAEAFQTPAFKERRALGSQSVLILFSLLFVRFSEWGISYSFWVRSYSGWGILPPQYGVLLLELLDELLE